MLNGLQSYFHILHSLILCRSPDLNPFCPLRQRRKQQLLHLRNSLNRNLPPLPALTAPIPTATTTTTTTTTTTATTTSVPTVVPTTTTASTDFFDDGGFGTDDYDVPAQQPQQPTTDDGDNISESDDEEPEFAIDVNADEPSAITEVDEDEALQWPTYIKNISYLKYKFQPAPTYPELHDFQPPDISDEVRIESTDDIAQWLLVWLRLNGGLSLRQVAFVQNFGQIIHTLTQEDCGAAIKKRLRTTGRVDRDMG